MIEFYTKYKRPEANPEKMDPHSKTEKAGYIPAKIQIENMIMAGQRLGDYRREMYDFGAEDKVDEDFMDPTRNPNYDMADASQDMMQIKAEIKRKKEEKDLTSQIKDDKLVSGGQNEEDKKVSPDASGDG